MAILEVVVGSTIACSYILFGNAITQSFMGVPALLVEFPPAAAGARAEGGTAATPGPALVARAGLLGRQWPVFWLVGNRFFRPISTLGIVGYGSAAVACFLARGATTTAAAMTAGRISSSSSSSSSIITVRGDWRVYALAAVCHLVTVVHSAVNMQPVNEKIEALGVLGAEEDDEEDGSSSSSKNSSRRRRHDKAALRPELAETYARTWIRYNTVRLITPVVAGTLALTQILGTGVATTTLPVVY